MVSMRMIRSKLLLCAFLVTSEAFVPLKPSTTHRVDQTLHVGLSQVHAEQEDEAAYLMQKARECAFSDTCSVEQARHYLSEVVHVQSGCAAGTLVSHQLCHEQDAVAEIVAHLRAKADQAQGVGVRLWQIGSDAAVIYPEGGLVDRNTDTVPMAGALFLIAGLLFHAGMRPEDHVSLTLQELWWASRDGYLNIMVHHFLQNGGL